MKKLFLFFPLAWYLAGAVSLSQIILENNDLRLTFNERGEAISLVSRATDEECLEKGGSMPAFTALQYRPYDNETQLTRVTRPTTFPANRLEKKGDTLLVGFRDLDYTAVISIRKEEHYLGFRLEYFLQKKKRLGVAQETRIDEMTILQLPVRDRSHFGEWLDVSWDKKTAVCLLGTDVYTRIDDQAEEGYHIMRAGSVREVKLTHTGAALIVAPTDQLLHRIAGVEEDYNMPRGVSSRQDPRYQYSYYECRGVTPENIEEHIRYAREGGFRMMVIYYPDFASSMGHFPWRKEYPHGMEDLKYVTGKIREAGMIPGFHIHYNKAQINDAYVTPVPDPRLNLRKIFTLAAPLADTATVVRVEENPEGITLHEGRRLLRIGNEIIEYTSYSTERPYRFTGCKRGMLNTRISAFPEGHKLGLLDVDSWPVFIRFDQRTSIQDEVADRLARIVRQAGFRFIYFDGAEDVNRPYWFNVAYAMDRVYDKLDPRPWFSEGACKTHYNWHILSRGNAFDIFRPEEIKEAVDKRHIPAAAYNADNFTAVDFGWIGYDLPDSTTIGTQPDMISYIASHATGWDCPLSFIGTLETLEKHPRTKDNLAVLKRWEDARQKGVFSEQQKEELKIPGKEFILLQDAKGQYGLYGCRQIKNVAGNDPEIRAFLFRKDGRVWVEYWHTCGEAVLELPVPAGRVKGMDASGLKMRMKRTGNGNILVPAGDIRYLSFDMDVQEVERVFEKGIVHKK